MHWLMALEAAGDSALHLLTLPPGIDLLFCNLAVAPVMTLCETGSAWKVWKQSS